MLDYAFLHVHACSSSNVPVLPPVHCCCRVVVFILVPHLLVRGNHFCVPLTGVQWLLVVAHIPALLSTASHVCGVSEHHLIKRTHACLAINVLPC